jgi:hypothetical protein
MTRRIMGVVLAALILASVSPASAQLGPYHEENFQQEPTGWTENHGIDLTSEGHVGHGLLSEIRVGDHWGSRAFWNFQDNLGFEPEDLYWCYWVMFDADNYIEPPNRGKLPGPAGLYTYNCLGNRPSTPEEPCWSARMMFARDYPRWPETDPADGRDGETRIGFYVYHLDQPNDYGNSWDWDCDLSILQNGTWHCLEGRINLNTLGASDGVLQGWVDDQLAFDRDDLRFRRTDESDIDIRGFWFDVYYGGAIQSPVDNYITFDSLAFGPERIGCSGYDGTFTDDDHSAFEEEIEWLAASNITLGCDASGLLFCPEDSVIRSHMSSFLARALGLPAVAENRFSDVSGVHTGNINATAEAAITLSCVGDGSLFCPDDVVTRAQMGSFLARALGLDPVEENRFADVSGVHVGNINAIAGAGITLGCDADGTLFCPNEVVTRAQMAAFLFRALEEA